MFELKLKYKGYLLTINFPRKNYYGTFEVSPRKTLYHILFEELVDGKGLTPNQLVNKYRKECPSLADSMIRRMRRIIEQAVHQSPNPQVRALGFIKRKRGERGATITRKSRHGRHTTKELEIIEAVQRTLAHKSVAQQREEMIRRFAKKGINMPFSITSARLKRGRH